MHKVDCSRDRKSSFNQKKKHNSFYIDNDYRHFPLSHTRRTLPIYLNTNKKCVGFFCGLVGLSYILLYFVVLTLFSLFKPDRLTASRFAVRFLYIIHTHTHSHTHHYMGTNYVWGGFECDFFCPRGVTQSPECDMCNPFFLLRILIAVLKCRCSYNKHKKNTHTQNYCLIYPYIYDWLSLASISIHFAPDDGPLGPIYIHTKKNNKNEQTHKKKPIRGVMCVRGAWRGVSVRVARQPSIGWERLARSV